MFLLVLLLLVGAQDLTNDIFHNSTLIWNFNISQDNSTGKVGTVFGNPSLNTTFAFTNVAVHFDGNDYVKFEDFKEHS